ncbi:zinc dependent phospholipase C family protein [Anaeromicropila populeti]|uniref:Phospholipase C n=1 Tax=Anaeromicropila populeti TaxID=37658 RepID=A0A1I6K074_9FIRM|nr:zinc dependent phospholipase C family protein [Anaeromicropila populeti]SFR84639.1 Zinc dependent phospholipase C [Anaeromicropila populeti]
MRKVNVCKILSMILCLSLLLANSMMVSAKEKGETTDVKVLLENAVVKAAAEQAFSLSLDEVDSQEIELLFCSDGPNHTHQYIVNSAVLILAKDQGTSKFNETQYLTILRNYTDWPDVIGNETDYLTFAGHFYDPSTGKNWLGQKSPTAKTRGVSYYNKAVTAYRSGNISLAFQYIGIGSHYVSDINEPHHASNLTAINSNHTEFEEYVDANRTSFIIPGNTLPASAYTEAKAVAVGDLLHAGAVYSKSLANLAQNNSTYYAAGNLCVKHAILNVTQYFYKFGVEVGIYQ